MHHITFVLPTRMLLSSNSRQQLGIRRRGDVSKRREERDSESLTVTAYDVNGVPVAPLLHRLLGWTFCCSPANLSVRWSLLYDIHHENEDHGDNALSNLRVRPAGGEGGHRQESGALGPPARRRRCR